MKIEATQKNIRGEWKCLSLQDIGVKIIDGDRGKNYPKQNDFLPNGSCLFLTASNVTKNGFVFDQNQFISKEKDLSMSKGRLERGDLVITTRGTIGSVAFFSSRVLYESIRVNSGMAILRNNSKKTHLRTEFLYKYFISSKFLKEIKRVSFGSAQPQLTISIINKLKTNIPVEIGEQDRIIAVLETWDKAIERLSKKIEIKKQIKKGLMQEMLTGKTRLLGFNEAYECVKMKTVCSVQKGQQLNKTEMTSSGNYAALNGGIDPSGYTDKWNTKEGTITISEGGNSCGYVNFNEKKFWCGGHCYAINPKKGIDNLFLYQVLKLNERRIMSLRVGSGLPNIQKKALDNLKIEIPKDFNEQVAVSGVLVRADQEIKKLGDKLLLLSNQKKYLLNNLITGVIRTSETFKK